MKEIRSKRSLNLIANFVDGFAEGWYFAVGEFFKDQLDIKYTERIEKGKKVMRLTQGPYFCFSEGHVIYDTPKAYLPWSEALKHINIRCEVLRAVPNRVDENRNFINGSVTFALRKPNSDRTGIVTIDHYHLSQNEFIEFLKTGGAKARKSDDETIFLSLPFKADSD